ncbi:MAG: HAD-IC family P-type ATPase [Caldilineaceae bacterium]
MPNDPHHHHQPIDTSETVDAPEHAGASFDQAPPTKVTPPHHDHASHDHASTTDTHAAHVDHGDHELIFRNRFWVCLLLTLPVLLYSHMLQMWFGYTVPAFPGSQWIAPLFALVIFFYGGIPFLQMARPELQNRTPGMMVLISLAITVALVYSLAALWIDPSGGFFWEMALLIDVMLLGHWLEMRSVRQASGALNELAKLLPDSAERIEADGNMVQVAISELRTNDLVLVRPGASVPADGMVEAGSSDVNEAMITGESQPIKKQVGSKVIAGTINSDSSLRVRVTAIGESTALASIMRLVKQAQESKSATQLLADRAAGWLFYIALGVAILTALAWTLVTGFNLDVIQRVATVLVIACPHALGLAHW